jgi:uncharacterized damage-inducible protein DinB
MTVDDLRMLFEYGSWANHRLFEALGQLTPEQFTRSVAGSYGSIRNTLVHALSAEWGWLDRCGGAKRGAALTPTDYPTVGSVSERWQQVEQHMREFLSTLKDDDLSRPITFSFGDGPSHTKSLGHLLRHAANHGVHHRGQVSLLVRMLGYAPGNIDLLFYEGGS